MSICQAATPVPGAQVKVAEEPGRVLPGAGESITAGMVRLVPPGVSVTIMVSPIGSSVEGKVDGVLSETVMVSPMGRSVDGNRLSQQRHIPD